VSKFEKFASNFAGGFDAIEDGAPTTLKFMSKIEIIASSFAGGLVMASRLGLCRA
jgi:hypothetical protein